MTRAERNRLVEDNLAAARGCFKRFMERIPATVAVDAPSLLSACYEGMIHAADVYDPDRGAQFVGFAWLRMWGAMQDELRKNDWLTRSLRVGIRTLEEAEAKLGDELQRTPTVDEMCEAAGITRAEYAKLTLARQHGFMSSLSSPLQVRRDGVNEVVEVGDLVSDPVDGFAVSAEMNELRAGWKTLTDRERFVLVELIVNDRPGLDVAHDLGVTESRVSQIRKAAAEKLRAYRDAA